MLDNGCVNVLMNFTIILDITQKKKEFLQNDRLCLLMNIDIYRGKNVSPSYMADKGEI